MRLRMKAPDGPHCMKISPNSNLHFMLATYNIHAPSADEEGEEGHVSQDHDKHVYLSDLLIDVKDVLAAALVPYIAIRATMTSMKCFLLRALHCRVPFLTGLWASVFLNVWAVASCEYSRIALICLGA